jgi:molybdate transport system substrate-binding protein
MRTKSYWFIAGILLLTGCNGEPGSKSQPHPSAAQTTAVPEKTVIKVAAASDLKFALDDVLAEFAKQHPEIHVETSYGSSGNFFAQLSNQAPFDLFLSADIDFPHKLIEQGQGIAGSEFTYAVGHLVVWVRKESPLDVEQLGIQVLTDPSVRKIAIANPKVAPYGRAAEAALQHFELKDAINDKLVLGENIAHTAQFVESGAADAGIIALSLALSPAMQEKGKYWPVPLDAHPALTQGGVILSWTKHRPACEQLRSFLVEESGRTILKRYGFLLPGE